MVHAESQADRKPGAGPRRPIGPSHHFDGIILQFGAHVQNNGSSAGDRELPAAASGTAHEAPAERRTGCQPVSIGRGLVPTCHRFRDAGGTPLGSAPQAPIK